MKDKRLDALLESLPITCKFWRDEGITQLCTMEHIPGFPTQGEWDYPRTYCAGDIRKCEREE